MRAGRLKHRVILERLSNSDDEAGGFTPVYYPVKVIWMALEPIRSKETIGSDMVLGVSIVRGISRYVEGVSHTNRVRWGNRVYEVVGPPKVIDEVKREMEWQLRDSGIIS